MLSFSCLSVLSVTLVYCGQMFGWINMPLSIEVGLSPGHIVLDGDPTPPKKEHSSPQFSAYVYCGQTAEWIRIPLGTELGLGPGDIVIDGNTAPTTPNGAQPPNFWPCLLWPNGWMDKDATWYRGRPQPRPYCARWDPAPPKNGTAPPLFGACLLWPNGWMDDVM